MSDLNCVNQFRVGVQGDRIVCLAPMKYRMSADEAINLAAWLVACADPVGSRFLTLFAAITSQDESEALASMDEAGPQRRARDQQHGADLGKPPTNHELGGEA